MFSGIVEAIGTVEKVERRSGHLYVLIRLPLGWTPKSGESISIDGVCSTVRSVKNGLFEVEFMPETLRRTTFSDLGKGSRLNLEMALRLNSLVGGHLVQGHADCVGTIKRVRKDKGSKIYEIAFDKKFAKYVVPKGFVAVDGISLTVVDCRQGWLNVALIQHTLSHTTLGQKKSGDRVNLEFDMVGKYVVGFLEGGKNEC